MSDDLINIKVNQKEIQVDKNLTVKSLVKKFQDFAITTNSL
jgi:sulfur carrier protein ThiS